MTGDGLPTRTLRERPDLEQLKRQAKELLEEFRAGEPAAFAEVSLHYQNPDQAAFALHDAQLVIARAYGFHSWPKLKAYVEGATDRAFVAAVRARDLSQVRAMLAARSELSARTGALHAAVLDRSPEFVRLLMLHGANPRAGVYPHRDATSPLTIATDRGYDDVVAIIRESEHRRQSVASAEMPADALFEAIRSGNDERARALVAANPALVRARHPVFDWMPLHVAAHKLNARLVPFFLDHGADVMATAGRDDLTSLDAVFQPFAGVPEKTDRTPDRFATVSRALLERGAAMTARAAVALGRAEWLRSKHAEGVLENPIGDWGGLLTIAVIHDRPEVLALLLEFGFDPDERTRFGDVGGDEVVFTWGMPLWHGAALQSHAMAEMLLQHGADPNARVHASGTPVSEAFGQADWTMIRLLERYGGVIDASTAARYRQTEVAKRWLANAADKRQIAEQLLGPAACGGDPEIVRLALEHIDWSPQDSRWFGVLEQPLRIWNHGPGHWAKHEWDRSTYQACFRLIVQRCDPNLRGRLDQPVSFGLTTLHSVAGSREHMTPEERVAFATMLLDAGARTDIRDHLLQSTPLGWACRWGRIELVKLLLMREADPSETDAQPWATPLAWARQKRHPEIVAILRQAGARVDHPL